MSKRAVILLAEDEESDAYFVNMAFKKAGLNHSIAHVSDGQQLIEYLSGEGRFADRAKHPMPNLVLLDLKMPRANGLDVLTWLRGRAELKDLPVVVLTSSDYPGDIEQACKLGAADYRLKPSSPQQLVQFALDVDANWLKGKSKAQPQRTAR
ncbi:MAG TPA: response regulator [Verrucomicrobiae bacterium]|jgi:CheY-like chemotaxis protein|nr:response regulator [Verrucomicrobiae bacterium]